MMNTRLAQSTDFQSFKGWWGARWGDAPLEGIIPKSGVVVESDGVAVAAGWLYLDMTTSVSIISWIVTNPKNTDTESHRSLKLLIGGLVELSKSQGRDSILTACPGGSLSRLFQSCGFTPRDKQIEHLTLNL